MAISTYAELQTAIDNWLKLNSSTDYTDRIPEWITIAEAEINRTLRTFRQKADVEANYLPTDTDRRIALAGYFVELCAAFVRYASEPESSYRPLRWVSEADIHSMIAAERRLPRVISIHNDNMEFEAYPDAAAKVNFIFLRTYDIESDSTNWLLTNHPDAYLYGALAVGHDYRWNGPKQQDLYARFRNVLTQINEVDERTCGLSEISVSEVGNMFGRSRYNIVTGGYG